MVSDICNNLLSSVCAAFRTDLQESEFARTSLRIFLDSLGSKRGMVLAYRKNQITTITSLPGRMEDYVKDEIIMAVVMSSLTGGRSVPSVIQVENRRLNVLRAGDYGFIILCCDAILDELLLDCVQPAADHTGTLLTMLSDHRQEQKKNLAMENLAFVASKTRDIVCITDSYGLITYVNDAYTRKTGYTLDEGKGKRPSKLLHGPETDSDTKKRILGAILKHEHVRDEILNYSKAKDKFWLQLSIDPVFDDKGKCIAFVSVSKDITERVVAEKELRHKEKMLRSIAASSNEFLVNTDIAEAISRSLPIIGEAVDVDRVYFFRNTLTAGGKLLTSQISEWNSGSVAPQIDNPQLQNLPIEIIDIFLDDLYLRKPVTSVVSGLPQDHPYKKMLESQQVKSLLIIPIFIRDFFWGLVGFDECRQERVWAEDEISILQYFCITVANAVERISVTDALVTSETRLSALIKNLKEGILLEDDQRTIAFTNISFTRLFGLKEQPEELIGKDCSWLADIAGSLVREPVKFGERITEILSEKKPSLAEEIEMLNGDVFERDYHPILVDNVLIGHLWKYSDISERKQRERTLKQKEEKYRNIIANMKMSLVETDTEDTVTYVNQEFCDMTGYSAGMIIGRKTVDLLVADGYKEIVKSKYSDRREGFSDIYPMQVVLRNGELRWWLTSGGPNFNDRGELTGTIGISVDITDQKNIEEELKISRQKAEESSNAKEAFLAGMSHEIRTPLNVIIGMLRELGRESLTSKQMLYLKNAELSSHHLLSIVNDVLDITKIASGQLNLDIGSFCLYDLIEEVMQMLSPEANEKMLNIASTVSMVLAPVYKGDATRIKQILINIISNSIKFTEKGGIACECILLSKNRNTHRIKIKISDTGIGMDESFLNHIFDKFSQGDYSSARKAGGTGLGMAITYELVKMMNGDITVASRVDYGTTTEITLDLEVGSVEEIKTTIESEPFRDLMHKKVLLVEDSDLNRLVALNSLEYYGIAVTEATNGYEAVEKVREYSFDAVLMDLQMPVMGGIEATKIIREELKLNLPVIALTAHAFKAEIDRCIEAGMNDYIIKPFEENTLMSVLLRNMKNEKIPAAEAADRSDQTKPGAKMYNLEAIEKMSRGDTGFINRIVQVFIDQTPAAVEEISAALENGDFDTIRKLAHKIKPNIDNFGISELRDDIRAIEILAGSGAFSHELESRIRKLEFIIGEVVKELAERN